MDFRGIEKNSGLSFAFWFLHKRGFILKSGIEGDDMGYTKEFKISFIKIIINEKDLKRLIS